MSCPTLPVSSNEIDHSAEDATKLIKYSMNTISTREFQQLHVKHYQFAGVTKVNSLKFYNFVRNTLV